MNKATQSEPEEISGAVESVVYSNDETGYRVFKVRVVGGGYYGAKDEPVTVSGKCPTLWEGEEIRAKGRWIKHPQYGLQFETESITCVVPTSVEGIERYLKSGMIKGIGPVYAKKIVGHFGGKTLEMIDSNSARLLEIPGIGAERKRIIKESWDAQRGNRETMIFLQSNGIGAASSARIIRAYGAGAIAVVKQTPYRLCDDIWGIGFLKADEIAMKVGIPQDSPERAKAGLHYALGKLADEGHCFCREPDLLLRAEALVHISIEILAEALKAECEAGRLVKDTPADTDDNRIYLRRLWNAESRTAAKALALLAEKPRFPSFNAAGAVSWAEEKIGMKFAPKQSAALEMALMSKVSVITGGPGVGKTTIIRALCDIWGAKRLRVSLVAPTGRAAKRMSESTGHEAKTIHRYLKFNPQTRRFVFNAENPTDTDVLIADETSMIDIELAADLLAALRGSATVVFVGDTDQLPSVGPGNFLRDLIASGAMPCTKLDMIFRQKSGGGIVRNAHLVNAGEMFENGERASPQADSDFFFVNCESPEKTLENVVEMVKYRIPRKFAMSPLADVQVLTPMRKNSLGADNLNLVLQNALNPSGVSVQRLGRHYRVGDRVMQLRNNYDKDVFNGDLGFIKTIDLADSILTVDFDGTPVEYDFNELDELTHSYAVTIHKSQGSEYPAVIVVLATQHFVLLQRNLLYTAITRGKRLVIVLGTYKAVSIAVKNNDTQARATALAEKLRK